LLRERDARTEQMQDELVSRNAVLATGKLEIEHLKLLIAKLRHMQSGVATGEVGELQRDAVATAG
jgi:hypothetical protein